MGAGVRQARRRSAAPEREPTRPSAAAAPPVEGAVGGAVAPGARLPPVAANITLPFSGEVPFLPIGAEVRPGELNEVFDLDIPAAQPQERRQRRRTVATAAGEGPGGRTSRVGRHVTRRDNIRVAPRQEQRPTAATSRRQPVGGAVARVERGAVARGAVARGAVARSIGARGAVARSVGARGPGAGGPDAGGAAARIAAARIAAARVAAARIASARAADARGAAVQSTAARVAAARGSAARSSRGAGAIPRARSSQRTVQRTPAAANRTSPITSIDAEIRPRALDEIIEQEHIPATVQDAQPPPVREAFVEPAPAPTRREPGRRDTSGRQPPRIVRRRTDALRPRPPVVHTETQARPTEGPSGAQTAHEGPSEAQASRRRTRIPRPQTAQEQAQSQGARGTSAKSRPSTAPKQLVAGKPPRKSRVPWPISQRQFVSDGAREESSITASATAPRESVGGAAPTESAIPQPHDTTGQSGRQPVPTNQSEAQPEIPRRPPGPALSSSTQAIVSRMTANRASGTVRQRLLTEYELEQVTGRRRGTPRRDRPRTITERARDDLRRALENSREGIIAFHDGIPTMNISVATC